MRSTKNEYMFLEKRMVRQTTRFFLALNSSGNCLIEQERYHRRYLYMSAQELCKSMLYICTCNLGDLQPWEEERFIDESERQGNESLRFLIKRYENETYLYIQRWYGLKPNYALTFTQEELIELREELVRVFEGFGFTLPHQDSVTEINMPSSEKVLQRECEYARSFGNPPSSGRGKRKPVQQPRLNAKKWDL